LGPSNHENAAILRNGHSFGEFEMNTPGETAPQLDVHNAYIGTMIGLFEGYENAKTRKLRETALRELLYNHWIEPDLLHADNPTGDEFAVIRLTINDPADMHSKKQLQLNDMLVFLLTNSSPANSWSANIKNEFVPALTNDEKDLILHTIADAASTWFKNDLQNPPSPNVGNLIEILDFAKKMLYVEVRLPAETSAAMESFVLQLTDKLSFHNPDFNNSVELHHMGSAFTAFRNFFMALPAEKMTELDSSYLNAAKSLAVKAGQWMTMNSNAPSTRGRLDIMDPHLLPWAIAADDDNTGRAIALADARKDHDAPSYRSDWAKDQGEQLASALKTAQLPGMRSVAGGKPALRAGD
jgi:hypothetical protein